MQATIIIIGDEILNGQTLDTNSNWLAMQLGAFGFQVNAIYTIADKAEQIMDALRNAQDKTELILTTGGLGPTKDDITKDTFCRFFDVSLIQNADVLKQLTNSFAQRGIALTERNISQAMLPSNASLIPNQHGTAPGMWFESQGKIFISMPGVPFEMRSMFDNEVLPKLNAFFETPTIYHRHVNTVGIAESMLADKISDFENSIPADIHIAYLPSLAQVRIRLSAQGTDEHGIKIAVDNHVDKLTSIISEYIYGYDNITLEERVGELLRSKGLSIATAESCTGGYLSHLITSVAGSSEYYKGSIIAYSDAIKREALGVQKATLEAYGAVSEATVREMVHGALEAIGADIVVAITGIAGPGGGTDEKPVGTIWIGIGDKDKIKTVQYLFKGNRLQNITMTAIYALDLVRKHLS